MLGSPFGSGQGPAAPPLDDEEEMMYSYKVKPCPKIRPHDWCSCSYSHVGEKARRRDPLKYTYSAIACPDFRRFGSCSRGDACSQAHGIFECWLHPQRYRTQICSDGLKCNRRICFFAHTEAQLRKLKDGPLKLHQQLQADLAAAQAVGQQGHAPDVWETQEGLDRLMMQTSGQPVGLPEPPLGAATQPPGLLVSLGPGAGPASHQPAGSWLAASPSGVPLLVLPGSGQAVPGGQVHFVESPGPSGGHPQQLQAMYSLPQQQGQLPQQQLLQGMPVSAMSAPTPWGVQGPFPSSQPMVLLPQHLAQYAPASAPMPLPGQLPGSASMSASFTNPATQLQHQGSIAPARLQPAGSLAPAPLQQHGSFASMSAPYSTPAAPLQPHGSIAPAPLQQHGSFASVSAPYSTSVAPPLQPQGSIAPAPLPAPLQHQGSLSVAQGSVTSLSVPYSTPAPPLQQLGSITPAPLQPAGTIPPGPQLQQQSSLSVAPQTSPRGAQPPTAPPVHAVDPAPQVLSSQAPPASQQLLTAPQTPQQLAAPEVPHRLLAAPQGAQQLLTATQTTQQLQAPHVPQQLLASAPQSTQPLQAPQSTQQLLLALQQQQQQLLAVLQQQQQEQQQQQQQQQLSQPAPQQPGMLSSIQLAEQLQSMGLAHQVQRGPSGEGSGPQQTSGMTQGMVGGGPGLVGVRPALYPGGPGPSGPGPSGLPLQQQQQQQQQLAHALRSAVRDPQQQQQHPLWVPAQPPPLPPPQQQQQQQGAPTASQAQPPLAPAHLLELIGKMQAQRVSHAHPGGGGAPAGSGLQLTPAALAVQRGLGGSFKVGQQVQAGQQVLGPGHPQQVHMRKGSEGSMSMSRVLKASSSHGSRGSQQMEGYSAAAAHMLQQELGKDSSLTTSPMLTTFSSCSSPTDPAHALGMSRCPSGNTSGGSNLPAGVLVGGEVVQASEPDLATKSTGEATLQQPLALQGLQEGSTAVGPREVLMFGAAPMPSSTCGPL